MKKFNVTTLLTGLVLLACLALSSCKKSSDPEPPTATFTYVADSRVVTFTSTSKNAKSYSWDFGDTQTSTEQNPVHTYDDFGKYTVKLTVTGDGGSTTSLPDELTLAKSSHVVIDGNVSEWSDLPEIETPGAFGTITSVKADYDALKIYFLVEGTADLGGFFDIYLNTDDDSLTGYFSNWYPAGYGADFLIEGDFAIVHDADMFQKNPEGETTAWDWTSASTVGGGVIASSALTTSGTGKAIEFSISRAAFTNLASKFAFAIVDVDGNYAYPDGSLSRPEHTAGWGVIGSYPIDHTPLGKMLYVDLTK